MSDIPEWAWRRAVELAGFDWELYKECVYGMGGTKAVGAFARYIAQHEEPPRDRLRDMLDSAGCEEGFHISADFVESVRARLPAAAIKAIEDMDDD